MDNFFYNLNKKMANLAERQDLAESAVTERDLGKHNNATTGFKALAKKAGKEYGSKAAGERVAGAQFQKMKKAGQLEEAGMAEMDTGTLKSYRDKAEKQALDIDAALDQGRFTKKGKRELAKTMVKRDKGVRRADAKLASKGELNEEQLDELSVNKLNDIKGSANRIARDERMSGGDETRANKAERVAGKASVRANDKVQAGMKANQGKGVAEGHCSKCAPAPCSCNEGNAFTDKLKATAKGGKFKMGNKEYTDTSDIEEGAFKNLDIDRQEQEMKKSRHNPGNSPLRQVPGMQNLKPKSKEHPLKNVARGIKAFVKGEPEPMDEVKKAKPDYIDLDGDNNRKESMKKAAADKTRSTGTAFDPEARKKSKTDQEGTGNFDKKKVSTGTVYTRRHKEDDEEEVTSNEPKRKGRPKGPVKGPERVTAKAWKHKGGRAVKENEIGIMNRGEYDQEGDEVKGDMHTVIRHAQELEKHLRDGENLPTWVIEKVGQIKGMMTSISDYMMSQHERGAEQATGQEGIRIAEKAVSVKQRRAAGIAHAAQKGEIPKSKLRGASKAMAKMPEKELDKFASTKEKGLPKKVKETTTAGSVATSGEAPKSTKGMSFGKGVYEGAISESYNKKLNSVLSEGMNISVNMNAEGQKSINVSADGDDAEKLAEILKLAGLGSSHASGCSSCGQSPCGCETVDEAYGDTTATKNSPDWPTDTETTDDNDPYLRRLSGGLNGAKSTGQTTVPVIAGQRRRMSTMEENVELERSLFKTWKTYKG